MLWLATVYYRFNPGGATVILGASRYTTVSTQTSTAEPRCYPVSLQRSTEVGRKNTGVKRNHKNSKEITFVIYNQNVNCNP